jgi:UDP-N-acetylmuramoyl-tripeptide--D-alanyl-D-alanine ligase
MTPGNFNTTLGVVRTVREKLNATHEIFLCEMGARHINDIKKICDLVTPKYGIISSIGPQHLETFFTIENVINTKFELADSIPNDGKIFLNYNNEYIRNHKIDKNIVSYGFNDEEYIATDIKVTSKGSSFVVKTKNGEIQEFKTKLIGRHNVENILGAIAVSNSLGISLEELTYAVKTLEAVPHRLELVKGNKATIIDDAYNSNPVGAKMALDTLNCFEGTKILITPGMIELGDKQYECNKTFGSQAADICDYIVLVGKEQTKPIRDGIMEKNFNTENLYVADSFTEGMEWISKLNTDKEKFVLIENDLPDNY